jgi:putative aldouronate transport system permease protein
MIFPFWNVFTTSIIDVGEFYRRPFIIWPEEPTLRAYEFIFSSDRTLRGFAISIFITVVGTVYGLLVQASAAYAMSKKYLPGRRFFLVIITFTMFFSGGLIPYYLLIKNMHLINTIWVLILPGGISVWNFVIMKSFFNVLPVSLEESAKLDGANDIVVLLRIVLPLSMPLLATFALFSAVGIWNAWFDALIFLQDRKLHPLTLVMRELIFNSTLPPEMQSQFVAASEKNRSTPIFDEAVKMATVIVATVPILCVYPWLQKYFAKGVMLGSIKG